MNQRLKECKMEAVLGIFFDKLFIYNILLPLIVFGGIWAYCSLRPPNQKAHLVAAIEANNTNTVQSLLTKGVDVNGEAPNGRTPLMATFASKTPNLYIAELLIRRGAKVNARDREDSSTPLMLAAEKSGTYGNADGVNFLLKHGADINAVDTLESSALARAIEAGQVAGVRALLAAGAEPNDYSSLPGSPLARAARQGNTDIMQLLLDRGAAINGRGSLGDTALTEAAAYNRKNAVLLLLKHGANLDELGENKKTALQEASEKGNIEVVTLLKQAGARM